MLLQFSLDASQQAVDERNDAGLSIKIRVVVHVLKRFKQHCDSHLDLSRLCSLLYLQHWGRQNLHILEIPSSFFRSLYDTGLLCLKRRDVSFYFRYRQNLHYDLDIALF